MRPNLYEPPKSDISVATEPGSTVKAVVFGTLTEIFGTLLAGILIGIVYGVTLSRQGMSPEEIQRSLAYLDPWGWPPGTALVPGWC